MSKSLAGAQAMAKIPPAERRFRHSKMVTFLDSGAAEGMTVREIADAVGISRSPIEREFRKRGVVTTQGILARYRAAGTRGQDKAPRLAPGEAWNRISGLVQSGGSYTVNEIASITEVPLSTVKTQLREHGLAPVEGKVHGSRPEEEAELRLTPREVIQVEAALAGTNGQAAPGGPEPGGEWSMVTIIRDGTAVGLDEATGLLWRLKADIPL